MTFDLSAKLNMIDDDIKTESVTVPEEFAKDNETRIIEPLLDNFIEWIEFIKGARFVPAVKISSASGEGEEINRPRMAARCLRHSYASYHFAEFNDAGLTTKNLGHPDSTLLRKDYNGAVTKAQAKEFWAIRPSDCL